ncbi:MAG: hypothetical protein AAGJ28_02885 [Pseudomonadota bacterium]
MIPRPPLSALDGERLPGIGHNLGPPLDGAFSWRRHAWKRARAKLMPRLPLEVIRRRVRRARQLGLEYPAYASILMGTGRDIVGFMFTCDALGLRLERSLLLSESVVAKLRAIERCETLLATEGLMDPVPMAAEIAKAHAISVRAGARLPGSDTVPWTVGRDAIQSALAPLKLPTDAVVMIGTRAHERTWADAARMAKFLPADRYFASA